MRRLARHASLWGAGASVRTVLLTGVRVQVWPLPCGWGGPWGTLTRKGHLSMRILCLLPTVLSLYPHPKGARQPLQFARTAETHGNALCSWSGGKPWPLLIPQGESRHVPEGLHGTGRQPDPRQAVCSRAAGQGWQLPPTVPTSARHSRWALLPWGFLRAARKVQALLRPVPERTESLGLSQRLLCFLEECQVSGITPSGCEQEESLPGGWVRVPLRQEPRTLTCSRVHGTHSGGGGAFAWDPLSPSPPVSRTGSPRPALGSSPSDRARGRE